MPSVRLTVPSTGVGYEVGQEIGLNFGNPEQGHVIGSITSVVDIGIRVGLEIEFPADFRIPEFVSDDWMDSLVEGENT